MIELRKLHHILSPVATTRKTHDVRTFLESSWNLLRLRNYRQIKLVKRISPKVFGFVTIDKWM